MTRPEVPALKRMVALWNEILAAEKSPYLDQLLLEALRDGEHALELGAAMDRGAEAQVGAPGGPAS